MVLGHPSSHVHTYPVGTIAIRMSGSALELRGGIHIQGKCNVNNCIWGSQVSQALGNYAWRWVPHPHMYTPTLWEQGTVITMSGSAFELTEVASIPSED